MRWPVVLIAVGVTAGLLTACDTDNQLAPSLPRVLVLQVDGDHLRILTGTPCEGVDDVRVSFRDVDGPSVYARLAADPAVTVGAIGVGANVEATGFVPTEALPADFDWREYSQVEVSLDGSDGSVGVGAALLEPVKNKGASHTGDGTAYVRDEGWLTPQQIATGNEKTFLTPCTPDPARSKG